ncbi:CLUMA_CG009697, isoform A [Clunio marinus]|uniref:CLUMA_CG009697, isoform A n=1 Tax=Clunio marinus TaxID=568069 RepID=A0A1J1I7V8_9DIPT|nr:CLUMA_CG009697, isoform A [Clunio marinus]
MKTVVGDGGILSLKFTFLVVHHRYDDESHLILVRCTISKQMINFKVCKALNNDLVECSCRRYD